MAPRVYHQAAGGVWEGFDEDYAVAQSTIDNGNSGAFIWAMNPSDQCPLQAVNAPLLAANLTEILSPAYPYSPVPQYRKTNLATGWCTLTGQGGYCQE